VAAWNKERLQKLTSETGFLALAGLFWLEAGTHKIGSDPAADIRLPIRAPRHVGDITMADGEITFAAASGAQVTSDGQPVSELALRTDAADAGPHRLKFDGFTFMIIKRGERLGLRLWDRQAPTRTGFTGIPTYPVHRRWRVKARYVPYAEPRPIQIPTVVKTTTDAMLAGEVHFVLGGEACKLHPIAWPGDRELFFHFTDGTTGSETYGGGRFLVSKHPMDRAGELTLDFNRTYTPPCAFTEYATCPVPLEMNRLPVAVRAGERQR